MPALARAVVVVVVVVVVVAAACSGSRTTGGGSGGAVVGKRPCAAGREVVEWTSDGVGGRAKSCKDGGTVVRWDATPVGGSEMRAVMLHDADEDVVYSCAASWALATFKEPICTLYASKGVRDGCSVQRRTSRPGSGALRISFPDGRTVDLADEDRDGCPESVHTVSRSGASTTEAHDANADGHSEIVVKTTQQPCSLPSGPTGRPGGCPVSVSVQCDPDSDGRVDYSCARTAKDAEAACNAALCAR